MPLVRYWTDVRLWDRQRRFLAGESRCFLTYKGSGLTRDADQQRFTPRRRTTIPPLPRISRYNNSRVDLAQPRHLQSTTSARFRFSHTTTINTRLGNTHSSMNRRRIINPMLPAMRLRLRQCTLV